MPAATPDSLNLKGRAALITGAGTGIGRAIAETLAARGAFLGIHCHTSTEAANDVLATIRKASGNGVVLQADLGDESQADGLVERFLAASGRVDVLVNNAGTPVARAKIEDCTPELWRQALDVNVTSAFLVTRRAIPHLRASGHGSVINMLSLSVQTGGAGGAGPYAAAKGALQVFTRTLARELAPQVRVNSLMPGVIETRHHEVFTTADRMEQYRRETPLARNGTADEVAEAAAFLASDASRFITGALIDVNGGRFLR
jgi:3-oxoacyl-[acyl-carrier protein] reductase